MGYGGIPTYFGPTGERGYRFFGTHHRATRSSPYRAQLHRARSQTIDNPRDMFDMLNIRERGVAGRR